MNKKVLIAITLIVVVLMATPLVPTVQAKIMEVNDLEGCTEYYGSIGGANFFVLIPDDWTNALGDGMLLVICRGAGYTEDPRDYIGGLLYNWAVWLAQNGIATAASSYGSKGHDPKFGVIRTHQLTEFVIENYDVTGKVFIYGLSLGGGVALVLGESYPDVYSGVFDVAGLKDQAMEYDHAVETVNDNTPPFPDGTGDPFLWNFFVGGPAAFEESMGGTPDEKPQKYAKYSATSYTDLTIPVISLVHLNDDIVPYEQTIYYHSLVGDTWHVVATIMVDTPNPDSYSGDYYGHMDPIFGFLTQPYFNLLIEWSNGDIGAGDIPTQFPP